MNIPNLDERSHIREDPIYRMTILFNKELCKRIPDRTKNGGSKLIIKKIEEMIESREILPRANFQTFLMSEKWMLEVTKIGSEYPAIALAFIDIVPEDIHETLPKSTKIETYEDETHGVIHPISLTRYCEPLPITDQSSEASEQL
jgi:hypothetical protein